MSGLISRRMMLDKMISRKSLFSTNQDEYMALSEVDKARADEIDNCIADLRNASDAEPERKWIPVSEALPKDMDRLLVTIVRSDGSKRVRSGHYYKGYFMLDNGDTWNETDKEVLAWMPLVEPYTAAVVNLENNE